MDKWCVHIHIHKGGIDMVVNLSDNQKMAIAQQLANIIYEQILKKESENTSDTMRGSDQKS